jgi:hypothetical protein
MDIYDAFSSPHFLKRFRIRIGSALTFSSAPFESFSLQATSLPTMREQANCASMHPVHHWPPPVEKAAYFGKVYNCVVYQLENEGYSDMSADVLGVFGRGDTADEALKSLQSLAEERAGSSAGGLFTETSDPTHQDNAFKDLEQFWAEDGVAVCGKVHGTITLLQAD